MREELKKYKEELILEVWEKKKNFWSIEDLANLFNSSQAQIYRALRKQKKSEN